MNNIILIGYMACGKTTIGRQLSKQLDMDFKDTDAMIVEEAGMSINEIFDRFGQEHFRDMETEVARKLSDINKPTVISTGGGMVLRAENAELLKKAGFRVFLNVSPETVFERVKNDTERPLLREKDPMNTIKTMMAQRMDKYKAAADVIINCDGRSVSDIADEIIAVCK